jgi:hypothetical protein
MRSTVSPHRIFGFAICKECFWTVTVLNPELYHQSVCPICFGFIDRVPMGNASETKIVDFLSKHNDFEPGMNDSWISSQEESWMMHEYLPHVS